MSDMLPPEQRIGTGVPWYLSCNVCEGDRRTCGHNACEEDE